MKLMKNIIIILIFSIPIKINYITDKVIQREYMITTVSYYSKNFENKTTAYGETFKNNRLTAASNKLPYNTKLLLIYKDKSIVVRVNDKGPYYRYKNRYIAHRERGLDLSQSSFQKLEKLNQGLITIKYLIL
jgi:rare lipoprotein A